MNDDNGAYIYPDLETALVGKFDKDVMVDARAAKVKGQRCAGGVKELKFTQPLGASFSYDPTTKDSFGKHPHLRDVYEAERIEARYHLLSQAK